MPSGHCRGAAESCVTAHPVRAEDRALRRVIPILSLKPRKNARKIRGVLLTGKDLFVLNRAFLRGSDGFPGNSFVLWLQISFSDAIIAQRTAKTGLGAGWIFSQLQESAVVNSIFVGA